MRQKAQRRSRRIIGVWVAAAAVAVGVAVWTGGAAVARGQVVVVPDGPPFDCTSGTVGAWGEGDDGDALFSDALTLDDEFACVLRLRVINGSSLPVEITTVRLTGLGHGSGLLVDAVQLDGANLSSTWPEADEEEWAEPIDAVFRLTNEVVLEPGQAKVLLATLRPTGRDCVQRGTAVTTGATVGVGVWGLVGQRTMLDTTGFTFAGHGANAPECGR